MITVGSYVRAKEYGSSRILCGIVINITLNLIVLRTEDDHEYYCMLDTAVVLEHSQ